MDFINNQLLKMIWLNDGIGWLLIKVFGLSPTQRITATIQFFLFDTIKIFILLALLIFLMGLLQSYFPPERTRKLMANVRGFKGNIVAALIGTITPFCSCSSIPIFIGFTTGGLPLGVTFSFLISSPMVDLASMIMIMTFFGWKIALIYIVVGLILAVIGGTIIDKLHLENEIQDYIREMENREINYQAIRFKERLRFGWQQVTDIVKKVWLYIFIGVGIGAAIHNWIPVQLIQDVLGRNNPFSVLFATLIGAPIYADTFGVLPIAESLYNKGIPLGTILALLMSVTTISVPSLVMLSKVVKKKLLAIFIAICLLGILIIGLLFNALPLF